MYRVLYNGSFWNTTHEKKVDALQEIAAQKGYSSRIGQSPGPMSVQQKLDGEWVTIERF